MASEEEGGSPDPIGIFLGGQQYAIGYDGAKITARSPYFSQPIVITPPNSVSSYPGSTPPLLVGIPATGTQQMVFAICDNLDSEWDSALMLKAGGCVQCNSQVIIDYVTSTVIVAVGQEFTSTVKASGTVSGTITIGLNVYIELGELYKFDDSAVRKQYFNRLFHHNIFNDDVFNDGIFRDDIIKHTRVINQVNGNRHLHYSTVDIRRSDFLDVSEHFSLSSNNFNVLEYDHLFSSHVPDFPSKYSAAVQRFFDDVSRVVDAHNFQHEYFHVFPLYKFILKRNFNTRADAITINNDQFCKQCPFRAHIDISSCHKRRCNPVFNWCASELRQCPYITNQLASQLFFIFSKSSLIDLQQCPK
ncbi:hypothetical protein CGCA056_v013380 [Colletotrichum aenigma]|uniref:uncharacterized protein n=1 Tax=Colletotrichum aenigma TaxID=1215731 RepID=UPI001872BAFC|nr:uncharacterized protein CGCA056_v013380 [Colletotrichum aenigma]KAF5507737.1 hypothetical protein CGCA056_v013380 [Colletotrichum aenigma]